MDIRNLRALGQPWVVYRDLGVAHSATLLAAPGAAVAVPSGIDSGQKALVSDRVIVCGWHYDYTGTAGEGFNLFFRSYTSSPGGEEDRNIIESLTTTAVTQVNSHIDGVLIPGDGGAFSPPSELLHPAELRLTTVGPPATGTLIVWGVMSSSNDAILTNHYYGSPFDADTVPPN